MLFYQLWVVIENWQRKYARHSNDVIIKKISTYVHSQISYKTYISDFSYFKNYQ